MNGKELTDNSDKFIRKSNSKGVYGVPFMLRVKCTTGGREIEREEKSSLNLTYPILLLDLHNHIAESAYLNKKCA